MAKDILKEAIADAKAVREVALANAKAALEEAFTPKLQSMLSAKLSEELDSGEETELDEVQSLAIDAAGSFDRTASYGSKSDDSGIEESQDLDEVVDLEAILNELELEEGADADDETVDEGKEGGMGYKEYLKKEIEGDKDDKDDEDDDKEDLDEARPVYKADNVQTDHMYKADYITEGCTDCDDNFDLDSLLEEITKVDVKENNVKIKNNEKFLQERFKVSQKELNSIKKELNETKTAFKSIKAELNEVNLLNSKLLYVNRIFKINDLNDGQKLRVIESFDKANSVKETKLIYETIKDTFSIKNTTKSVPKKLKSIKEGFGMASKAVKSTAPKKVITETDNMVTRMQKLANIKIKQ
jgi:hypothetical protein